MAIGDPIRTMIRGMKMLDAGKSQQEVRTYMESRGATNIKFSQPQTVDVTVPKSKPVKYASIGKKQMRIGRSGTIITSGGLLTNNNTTIKKKTLLGQ